MSFVGSGVFVIPTCPGDKLSPCWCIFDCFSGQMTFWLGFYFLFLKRKGDFHLPKIYICFFPMLQSLQINWIKYENPNLCKN